MTPRIARVTADEARRLQPALVALLRDAVDDGASLGFLSPFDAGEASVYWHAVTGQVAAGSLVLLVARDAAGAVVGTAQLDLAMRPNGRHRAEVAKVMVHRTARRQGIGRLLMQALETEARRLGRSTLHLDTRAGDPSERLYRSLGWQVAGTIPRWARSATGALDATVFYFKLLEPADPASRPGPPAAGASP